MKALALSPRFRVLALTPLAVLAGWSLLWGSRYALMDSADLGRRIEEMALFRRGFDPYADPDATYPPSAWFVFDALIPPWSEPSLRVFWLVLNLVALVVLLEGVRRWIQANGGRKPPDGGLGSSEGGLEPPARPGFSTPRLWTAAALLTLAASKPVRAGLALGQFHLVPTALAVWAVWLVRVEKPKFAGLLLGLALVKPTMVLPVLVLWLVQGRISAVATAGSVQAGLWLAASAWLRKSPAALFRGWLRNARLQEAAGTIDLPTLLTRGDLDGLIPANAASLLALVACSVLFFRLRKTENPGLAGLALVVSALFAYHRHYDLVLLLPALAWLASRNTPSWRSRLAVVLALFLIAPVHVGPLRELAAAYDLVFLTLSYTFALALVLELHTEAASASCRAGFSLPLRSTTSEASGEASPTRSRFT